MFATTQSKLLQTTKHVSQRQRKRLNLFVTTQSRVEYQLCRKWHLVMPYLHGTPRRTLGQSLVL
jgi:hypothetical protein